MAGRLFRARRGSLRLVAAATPCILLALWQLRGGDESGAAFAVPATGLASAAPEVASTLTGRRAAAPQQLVPRLQAPDASGGGTPSGAAVANVVPPLWVVAFQGLLAYAAMVGGVAASLGSPAAIKGAVGILGMYVIMSVNEYVVHRYYQHLGINRTALSRWLRNMLGMKPFKTSGHMEHHAETLDDMTLDQKPEPILDADPFRGTAFSWSVSAQMTLNSNNNNNPFSEMWRLPSSLLACVSSWTLGRQKKKSVVVVVRRRVGTQCRASSPGLNSATNNSSNNNNSNSNNGNSNKNNNSNNKNNKNNNNNNRNSNSSADAASGAVGWRCGGHAASQAYLLEALAAALDEPGSEDEGETCGKSPQQQQQQQQQQKQQQQEQQQQQPQQQQQQKQQQEQEQLQEQEQQELWPCAGRRRRQLLEGFCQEAARGGESGGRALSALRASAQQLRALSSSELAAPLRALLSLGPGESKLLRGSVAFCRDLLRKHGVEKVNEALLSMLVAGLVTLNEHAAAEAVLLHSVARGCTRTRTLQPLLASFGASGDVQRLWRLFGTVLRPLVAGGHMPFSNQALIALLQGFSGRPGLQGEVLELLSCAVLGLPLASLNQLLEHFGGELITEEQMLTSGELNKDSNNKGSNNNGSSNNSSSNNSSSSNNNSSNNNSNNSGNNDSNSLGCPTASLRSSALQAAARRLSAETLERLQEALAHVGPSGLPASCVVDGANVGHHGSSSRMKAAFSEDSKVEVGNNNHNHDKRDLSRFFRHEQIAAVVAALESEGQAPLVVLPERYAWQQQQQQHGPRFAWRSLVEKWLRQGRLFVVRDDEPDDLVWIYATLLDDLAEGPAAVGNLRLSPTTITPRLFAVTRDKAVDHRATLWGWKPELPAKHQLEVERSWRRWSVERLRWYSLSFAGEEEDPPSFEGEIAVRLSGPTPALEIQRRGDTWYLPDEAGTTWLRLALPLPPPLGTAALVAGLSLHAMVWQTLHPAMHLLPDPPITYGFPGWSLAALRQSRYFRFLYANHEGHHRVPGAHGNYNVCFPLADHLFGTYRGYVPPKMAVA
ncbi:unnamed protein product [Polarella glacialis]|uniref:Fatty acid desaturase domain-containing protein n=1 Tax=Polarella glacialis TaxID=89957 RepID=A0A813LVU5_POLGL|nr:unnamed protein product [Polarella glacialis]